MKKNQSGFSVIEALLIFVIIGIIGGVGWYVWTKNKQQNSTTSETTTTTVAPIDPGPSQEDLLSKEWVRYKSGKGAFSIKLADGLSGVSDTSIDFMIFKTFTSNTGPAKVENVDGYGSDGFAALHIYQAKTSEMYKPEKPQNLKAEAFTTRSGVKGTKTTYADPYEPPCEDLGCNLGDLHVTYDFVNAQSGITTRVQYARRVANAESKIQNAITKDDPDYTASVDEMVSTLEFQK